MQIRKIQTVSGNTYWLYPDNYIRAEQTRAEFEDMPKVQVDGILLTEPRVGEHMHILPGPSGISWLTSRVVSIEFVEPEPMRRPELTSPV